MKTKKFFKIYSHIRVVEGKEKSIFYDFHKDKVIYINDALINLIKLFPKYSISDLEDKFRTQADLFSENMDYLKKNDIIFETDIPECFPDILLDLETPEILSNAVLEFNNSYDLNSLLDQLDVLAVKYVELRLHRLTQSEYQKTFESLEPFLNGTVKALQIFVDIEDRKLVEDFFIENEYPKIIRFVYYNARKSMALLEDNVEYCQTILSLDGIRCRNNDYKSNFIFSMEYFLEAQNFNPYYNKRVCIDYDGTVRNCLKNKKGFGKVGEIKIKDIVGTNEFQRLWHAKPDLIKDVMNHELRYNMFITNELVEQKSNTFKILE